MENNNSSNKGVFCDVDKCVHNIDGCNCDMKTIKISKGNLDNSHHCKSFASKK